MSDTPAPSEPPQPQFNLTLLGTFQLDRDGVSTAIHNGEKRVFALLGIRDRTMSRAAIAGVLWPDAPETNALGSLRTLLSRLQPEIRELLGVTISDLTLSDKVSTDLHRAEALARRLIGTSLEVADADMGLPAVVLLSADMLPDWYDDWIVDDARQWHALRVRALEALSGRLSAVGRFGDAIEAALAAISAEPLREHGYATLISIYLAEGNRTAALRVLADYRRTLGEETEAETGTDLSDLIDQARTPPELASVIRQAQTAMAGEDTSPFEVIAAGISMEPTIRHGDRLKISNKATLAPGRIVVAIHAGVWIVKRLVQGADGQLILRSDNVDDEVSLDDVEVQGVVVELHRVI